MLSEFLLFATLYLIIYYCEVPRKIILIIAKRRPCKIIKYNGEDVLRRYHLFELSNGTSVVLHQFIRSDPDRGYHDHPWSFGVSFILLGGYLERKIKRRSDPVGKKKSDVPIEEIWYKPGSLNIFNGYDYHRVFVPTNQDAWSVFVSGPRIKTWGFLKSESVVQKNVETGDKSVNQIYKYTSYSNSIEDSDGKWWLEDKYKPK